MTFLRSERVAAVLLVLAAALGVGLANSPIGPSLATVRDAHLDLPWLGLELSVGHWITDGLLAVFFFLAAIELRHELTHGELDTPRKALVPAIAAVGGVLVPALVYLAFVRDPALVDGWPIPTATDIAFALGVLALVGRGLPSRVRALLLALAVIDDLIAILLIAVLFTRDLQLVPLIAAVPVVLAFGFLSYRVRGRAAPVVVAALIALGLAAWVLVHLSGIHSTIAGVALGLAMAPAVAGPTRHALEPWSNGVILPVFAFTASLVVIPAVGISGLSPVFWGIAIALPVGKLIGITGGALIAGRLQPKSERTAAIPIADVLVVATLGGIGFTVSLLMNDLAFSAPHPVNAEGTLAVLCGSICAALIGAVVTGLRARALRRRTHTRPAL
ncbi:Na+/H+ antiporter NhaA [Lysinimonas soli]|uniref:Na(+)/H(+) antiporter NhaA n=1 Tax=Lysinimonas soli TaxID=1074233 RepID=A0ABW0NMC7_9MICO